MTSAHSTFRYLRVHAGTAKDWWQRATIPRLLVNVLGKFGRKVVRCKRGIQVILNMFRTKRIESDLLAKLVGLHLSLVALERMITAFYILRSEGAC